jgi:hypothetical protein
MASTQPPMGHDQERLQHHERLEAPHHESPPPPPTHSTSNRPRSLSQPCQKTAIHPEEYEDYE